MASFPREFWKYKMDPFRKRMKLSRCSIPHTVTVFMAAIRSSGIFLDKYFEDTRVHTERDFIFCGERVSPRFFLER